MEALGFAGALKKTRTEQKGGKPPEPKKGEEL
jgi:hypothetical protein